VNANREVLKKSLDVAWHRRSLVIYLCAVGVMLLVMCPVFFFATLGQAAMIVLLLLCAYSPFVIYHLYCIYEITKDPTRYQVFTAALDEPHPSFRGRIYFTSRVVEDRTGYVQKVDTAAIFHSAAFGKFSFDEYNKKTARLAYDDNTGRVVVLEVLNR
jgi:Ca2+/Na+ antiporter